MTPVEPGVTPFADDVVLHGGYAYTTNPSLSSVLANRRLTEAVLSVANLDGRSVLDIGCGDGTYTIELKDERRLRTIVGADPNVPALAAARARSSRKLPFVAASAYALPFADDSFEVAQLRGVLHHMDDPSAALAEALRVCSSVVVIEPNGYNPVLKVIERCSTYHREHGEKSYTPWRLDRWVAAVGGRVASRIFVGLVPMFCPDWMARFLKRVEPVVERVWPLSRVACAVYAFRGERRTSP